MSVLRLTDFRPFAAWSGLGYRINKGAHATWVDNIAMFAEQQVTKIPAQSAHRPTNQSGYGIRHNYGNHWRDCAPKGTSPNWQYDRDDEDSHDAYGFDYC